jgi:hypothetical protein
MEKTQRHHFNMKSGFAGDEARQDGTAGHLYDGVSATDKAALAQGFGQQVGSMFLSDLVTEGDLRRDASWAELRHVVQDLIAFMR